MSTEIEHMLAHKVKVEDVPLGMTFWVFLEHFKIRSKLCGYVKLNGNNARREDGTVCSIFTAERIATGMVFVEDPSKCTQS